MRFPWSREPEPDDDLSEALADHTETLDRAEKALDEAQVEIRNIRTEYAKADDQRQRRKAKA